ncbi:response regulator [Candidatus Gracilibacteria bacterium]|jgi:two-component system, chemotaxis family, response regulator PixH|nr:response regulator [Candidatus Gracilibacteria bacterium]NJM89418.1 response regulator [Hydrococcus sp. RU_2_2]NJP20180.1 response regulator [Hydrococcus sp. CRU_1_1]NJQ97902.1 response regulator [Hydrococcus sp. CSU_1_8]
MNTALIVEDSLTEQQILTEYLQDKGFRVSIANSAEDAIAKINSNQPDIIILDVILPGRSGFEMCREVKSNPITRQIPIVLCSTKGSDLDKFWGLKQGADAYLSKPVIADEFVHTVRQLIGK